MLHELLMRFLGLIHIWLCRIPRIGEKIARGLSWTFAIFPWLGGVRGNVSLEETRQNLINAGEMMNFPFEFSEVEGDHFMLELPFCPYGFDSPDHQRPCDTAMSMDKVMLGRCDADLIMRSGSSGCLPLI